MSNPYFLLYLAKLSIYVSQWKVRANYSSYLYSYIGEFLHCSVSMSILASLTMVLLHVKSGFKLSWPFAWLWGKQSCAPHNMRLSWSLLSLSGWETVFYSWTVYNKHDPMQRTMKKWAPWSECNIRCRACFNHLSFHVIFITNDFTWHLKYSQQINYWCQ